MQSVKGFDLFPLTFDENGKLSDAGQFKARVRLERRGMVHATLSHTDDKDFVHSVHSTTFPVATARANPESPGSS